MAGDASAFFRGTAALFYHLLPASSELRDAPLAWISGDLHLENFGSYIGNNRLAYFDINDFDEATLAPLSFEIVRLIAHLATAAPALGIDRRAVRRAALSLLQHFSSQLATGKSLWIERRLASGAVRKLLRNAAQRNQRDLLSSRTTLRKGRRRLNVDGQRALPLKGAERGAALALAQHAIAQLRLSADQMQELEPLDIARRVAGVGSLGLQRYVVLVRGDGRRDGARLLDLKLARESCLKIPRALPRLPWTNNAERIVLLQRRMQADSPALLCASEFAGHCYVLKELQPAQDRLSLVDIGSDAERRDNALRTLLQLSAWSMLRSSGWDGAASGQQLVSHAQRDNWQAPLADCGLEMAGKMKACWREFRTVWKSRPETLLRRAARRAR